MSTEHTSPSGLLRLVCVVLAIVMFLSVLGAVTVLDLRLLTSRSGISQILTETLSSALPQAPNFKLAAMAPAADIQAEEESSQGVLTQWLYEQLQEAYGGNAPFSPKQVSNFVENSTLKDFISDKLSGAVEDFYAQRGTVITREEIDQLITENSTLLEQELGFVIDDATRAEILAGVDKTGMLDELATKGVYGIISEQLSGIETPDDEKVTISGSSSGTNSGTNPGNEILTLLETLRKATSYTAVVIAAVVYLACAVGYFFASGKNIPGTLLGSGIPMLLVGLIYGSATLVFLAAPRLLGSSIVSTLVALFFRITAPVNLTVLGLGVVMVIGSIVMKSLAKKKAAEASV